MAQNEEGISVEQTYEVCLGELEDIARKTDGRSSWTKFLVMAAMWAVLKTFLIYFLYVRSNPLNLKLEAKIDLEHKLPKIEFKDNFPRRSKTMNLGSSSRKLMPKVVNRG